VTDARMATAGLYQFIAGWMVIMVYVVIANVVYFGKVLPTLHEAGLDGAAKSLPSEQAKQGRAALEVLRRQGQRGFAVRWLAAGSIVKMVLLLAVVALLASPATGAMR
jgi:hypothetical protein